MGELEKFAIKQKRLTEVKRDNAHFIKTVRDEKSSYEPPNKTPRTKAHETGMAIDKHVAMFVSAERGLGFFTMDADARQATPPWLWSHLWLGQDLESDGNFSGTRTTRTLM